MNRILLYSLNEPLNFESKLSDTCDLNVDCTKLASNIFMSDSKKTFSFPKNAIIVYTNCSVKLSDLTSLRFCNDKNVMVVQMTSFSGRYSHPSAMKVTNTFT